MDNTVGQKTNDKMFATVQEGMEVYDSEGKKVGKVKGIYMGAEADGPPGVEPASAPPMEPDGEDWVPTLFTTFKTHDIPDVVIARLRQHGFLRIDPGIIGSDRYALRDQVASVAGERVMLNVPGKSLIKL